MKQPRASEAGFSLIELLVAMTITLIVSGAIYGLMTAGQNAFRREPELAERQQSIRLAMDLITRDIANAGSGLPPLSQVFTTGLGGTSPVTGPSGFASDDLEMLAVSGQDSEPVCEGPGNGGPMSVALYRRGLTPVEIPVGTLMFLVFSEIPPTNVTPQTQDDRWVARRVTAPIVDSAPGSNPNPSITWDECSMTGVAQHTILSFTSPNPPYNSNPATLCANANVEPRGNYPPGAPCGNYRFTRAVFGKQIRYQIRADPTDGVPVLERISTENANPAPQVIARGIEELQVQYTQFSTAAGTWLDDAPPVSAPTTGDLLLADTQTRFGTMVNRLRISLTSRSEARNIQGAVNNAGGTDPRIRGSLAWTVSPRAALLGVARGRPLPPSPSPAVDWYWE